MQQRRQGTTDESKARSVTAVPNSTPVGPLAGSGIPGIVPVGPTSGSPSGSPPVLDLVTRATCGDEHAWDALVERYIPLVWSICRRHQLDNADAREVSQTVWRQFAGQLATFRNPEALSRWLASTAERECDRYRCAGTGPGQLAEAANSSSERTLTAEQELLVADRHAALREALAHLPPRCQRLIAMLIQDPPVPEAEISARLGIPARSVSQNRRSCLQQLRRYPAIATLIHAETKSQGSEE